jgi:prepilin-type N-terminal cleavage/methylation domain-containing protein/prepilin-type processing-associated H-X9-DG protein
MRRLSPDTRGFTLIELLVVIAIIAILAAILFPVFAKAREKANSNTCMNNERQIAIAIQMYIQDNDETLPLAISWVNGIAAYGGTDNKLFDCPSNREVGSTAKPDYFYVGGNYNGQEEYLSGRALGDFPDATIVPVVTDLADPGKHVPWVDGDANQSSDFVVGQVAMRHSANVAFLDGHVATFQNKDVTGALFAPAYNPNFAVSKPARLGNVTDGYTITEPSEALRQLLKGYNITTLLCKNPAVAPNVNNTTMGTLTTDSGTFPTWMTNTSVVALAPASYLTYYNTLDGILWNAADRWPLVGNQDYGGSGETSAKVTFTTPAGITPCSKRLAFILCVSYQTRVATFNYIKIGSTTYTFDKKIQANGGNTVATTYQACDSYVIPVLPSTTYEIKASMNNVSARAGIFFAVEP